MGKNDYRLAAALAAAFCLALCAQTALAEDRTWTGAVSSDWHTSGNWDPARVPDPADNLRISSGSVNISPGVAHAGTITWEGGYISGALTISAGGNLNLAGDADKVLYMATLSNQGTIMMSGNGALVAYSDYHGRNVTIDNQAGGVFDIQTDANIAFSQNAPYTASFTIQNAGTFRKSAGTGMNTFTPSNWTPIVFNNTGRIEVQTGGLKFPNGFDFAGTVDVAAGGTVAVTGGTVTLQPGSAITGAGKFSVPEGGVVLNGTLSGRLEWSGGMLKNCTLTVAPNSALNIVGDADKTMFTMTLNNQGTVNFSGNGALVAYSDYHNRNVTIDNQAEGLFDIQTDANIAFSQNAPYTASFTIQNAGTLRKSAGSGVNTFAPSSWTHIGFNNTGRVEVQTGGLKFPNGFDFAGTVDVAAGGTVAVTGGKVTLQPECTITGAGKFSIPEGGVAMEGTLNGIVEWSGGMLKNCTLTVASNSVLNIVGDTDKTMYTMALNNQGIVNFSGNGALVAYSDYYNRNVTVDNQAGGEFNIQTDANIAFSQSAGYVSDFVFQNAGVLRKSAGTGTNMFAPSAYRALTFNNSGRVEVQRGGLQFPNGLTTSGTIDVAQDAIFLVTGGSLALTPGNRLTGAGRVVIDGSAFNVNGTLDGALQWAGGRIVDSVLIVGGNGVLNLVGDAEKTMHRMALTNEGTIHWVGGTLVGYSDNHNQTLVIANQPNALFEIQTDMDIVYRQSGGYNPTFQFQNAGTLRKSSGTGTNTFAPSTWQPLNFNNTGRVEVRQGSLKFPIGFTNGGVFDLAEGSSVIVTGGTVTLAEGSSITGAGKVAIPEGDVIVNGTFDSTLDWTGGRLRYCSMTLSPIGVLNIDGEAEKHLFQMNLINKGTINWSGTGALIGDCNNHNQLVSIDNQAGALFHIQTDADIAYWQTGGYSSDFVVLNAGVLRKSSGPGTNTFVSSTWRPIIFNNTGRVDIQQGSIKFPAGFSNGGAIDVAPNSTVIVTSGTLTLNEGNSLGGGGKFVIPEGDVVLNGTLNGVLEWSGGMLKNCVVVVASNSVFNIIGDARKVLYCMAVTNEGTINWSSASPLVAYANNHNQVVTIANQPGALFDIQTDVNIVYEQAGGYSSIFSFLNAGVLRKSSGTGTNTFQSSPWRPVTVDNSGRIEVLQGGLLFPAGLTSSGTIDVATNGIVLVTGGGLKLDAGNEITGEGRAELAGGQIQLTGTVHGPLHWSSGWIRDCDFTVGADGVFDIAGDAEKYLYRMTITNEGAMTWSGSGAVVGYYDNHNQTVAIYNQPGALVDLQTDSRLSYGQASPWSDTFRFQNSGTLRKSGGTGESLFDSSSWRSIEFVNDGTVDIQSGAIHTEGGYASGANSTVRFAIGGPTPVVEHGQLIVDGTAALNGAIDATLEEGFVPAIGASFTTVAAGVVTGTFANAAVLNVGSGRYFVPEYVDSTVQLTARGAPVAVDDIAALDEDTAVDINVLANDTEESGGALLLAGFGQPAHGTVTQNADNTLRYQPAADFAGADAFTYTISDLSGITDEGEVQVTVRPVNDAPVLDPIANSAVAEGNELTFRATATDIDSAALSFSLGAGAPAGAAIDPATGVFTWRPTEAQGPGQYEIAIIVTDDGVPARTDTRPFSVTVTEVNTAPTLESIADKTINPGEEFSLQCVGTDADLPANVLSFGVTGPAGATIEPFGGVVHWRPGVALANTTNQFVVTVTDNGAPPLEASRTFNVIVGPLAEATLTAVGITGAHFQLQIDGTVGPEYTIQASTDLAAWADVVKTNISSSPCQVTIPDPAGTGYRFFRALLGP